MQESESKMHSKNKSSSASFNVSIFNNVNISVSSILGISSTYSSTASVI